MQLLLNFSHFLIRADRLEGINSFAPRGTSRASVAHRSGDFAKLAQHFGVQTPVLGAFCLVDRDAQCRNALAEGTALSLDRGADLRRASGGEVVAASLCLIESFRAADRKSVV